MAMPNFMYNALTSVGNSVNGELGCRAGARGTPGAEATQFGTHIIGDRSRGQTPSRNPKSEQTSNTISDLTRSRQITLQASVSRYARIFARR